MDSFYQRKKQWAPYHRVTNWTLEPGCAEGLHMVWDSLDKVISQIAAAAGQCSKGCPSSQILTTLLTHHSIQLSHWVANGPWWIGMQFQSQVSFCSWRFNTQPPHILHSASGTYSKSERHVLATSWVSEWQCREVWGQKKQPYLQLLWWMRCEFDWYNNRDIQTGNPCDPIQAIGIICQSEQTHGYITAKFRSAT